MTESLYPTKTRLALLRDVDDCNVSDDEDGSVWLTCDDGTKARVSAAVWEMERAGWVQQATDVWELTDAGRAVDPDLTFVCRNGCAA